MKPHYKINEESNDKNVIVVIENQKYRNPDRFSAASLQKKETKHQLKNTITSQFEVSLPHATEMKKIALSLDQHYYILY